MHQIHFIQKLYNKFYPQIFAKGLMNNNISEESLNFGPEEKKKKAGELLTKAEELLLNQDLSAIKYFNEACILDSSNSLVWYRQGLAFFEYGTITNSEKAFQLASKNFKIATSLEPEIFDFWLAWANVLLVLANHNEGYHYFLEAEKKYKQAINLSENQDDDILSEIYWDYAIILLKIADHSEEAFDIKKAIENFLKSLNYQKDVSASFYNDLAVAYLKMAQLVNDNNIYFQAIEYFTKATEKSKKYIDAYSSIAHSYTQLYINTLDEHYFQKANNFYETSLELNPLDADLWLDWANLLNESGMLNQDAKKLRASIEKCVRAKRRCKKNNKITAQWAESLALLGAYTNRLDLIIDAEKKIMKVTDSYDDEYELWYSYGMVLRAYSIYYNDIDYDFFAIEKFQIGLSLDRTSAELWHELGCTHLKLGQELEDIDLLERAIKFLVKAIDLKAASPALIFDYAKALTALSQLTLNLKTLEESIRQFEIALNLQKNAILSHPDWIFYYGISLDLLGDLNENESYYLKAIDIFNNVLLVKPNFKKIHFKLAMSFTHLLELNPKEEYFEKANSCFSLAARQDREDDIVYLEWALTIMSYTFENSLKDSSKHYLDAEKKLLKAGQLGNPHAHYHLACLYSITDRIEDSFHFLQKAKEFDMLPPIEEILEDEWLDNVRESSMFSHFLCDIEKKQNI